MPEVPEIVEQNNKLTYLLHYCLKKTIKNTWNKGFNMGVTATGVRGEVTVELEGDCGIEGVTGIGVQRGVTVEK